MSNFGVLSFLAATLQISVPTYAFRLVRRFGVQRVGWFIVLAFATLAMVYLVNPLRGTTGGSGLTFDLTSLLASALLVIGMGHLESLCAADQRAEREAGRQRSQLQEQAAARTAALTSELTKTNQELAQELARCQEREKVLAESEAQYRALFTDNPEPMWICDLRTGRFLAVNRAAVRHYGFSAQEFKTITLWDLVPSEGATALQQDMAKPCGAGECRGPWQHRKRDGTLVPVETTSLDLAFGGAPARLSVIHDLIPRQRRERQLCEEQKLKTMRQVAGGVAHHVNNLLAVIGGHTQFLRRKSLEPKASEQLSQISTAANRIAGVTRQLLAASGQQVLQRECVNLNHVIAEAMPLLRRLVGDQILVRTDCDKDLPGILGDPQVLQHVLVNLALNAREAMRQGGSLTLGTTALRVDGRQALDHVEAKPGDFVCLTVQDTGCGLPPQLQARLFEPFVTTREEAQALGLGLASVAGVVRQHGGWIDFHSQVGRGTEFRLYFPHAPKSEANLPVKDTSGAAFSTVLLVQAEERARGLVRYILTRQGYQVIEAADGHTALVLSENQALNLDVLLADITLPDGLSGPDLARQLRQSRPEIRVIYTGDCTPGVPGDQPTLEPGAKFIARPFSPDKLLQVMQA